MDQLDGIWRRIDSRAWDEQTNRRIALYGAHPLGHVAFCHGRMLAELCKSDTGAGSNGDRQFSSSGGLHSIAVTSLKVPVDVASDPAMVGIRQIRGVVMMGEEVQLQPPAQEHSRWPLSGPHGARIACTARTSCRTDLGVSPCASLGYAGRYLHTDLWRPPVPPQRDARCRTADFARRRTRVYVFAEMEIASAQRYPEDTTHLVPGIRFRQY